MNKQVELVKEFHTKFQAELGELKPSPLLDLRLKLIKEELQELEDAATAGDRTEALDAILDLLYVIYGFAIAFNIDKNLEQGFDRVHRSNMSKLCSSRAEATVTQQHYLSKTGTDSSVEKLSDTEFLVLRKGDRKVLKNVNYSPVYLGDLV